MFFSLLYLFTIVAILVFSVLSIRAITRNEPVGKWILGLVGVSFIYVLLVAISVWL